MTLLARADLYPLPGFHDPVSALTHLVGAVAFLILGSRMLRRQWGHWDRVAYLGVYVFACVFLLSMSTVYHMMEFGGSARAVMERLDHSAIFVLIAGTITPAHGLLFRGVWRWGFLLLIWSAAITGITLKAIFFSQIPEWLGLSLYLGMGWLGAVSAIHLYRRFGLYFILPMVLGGIAYSVGAVAEYFEWFALIPHVVEYHELFHIMVLVGAGFHFGFVTQFESGKVGRSAQRREADRSATRQVDPVNAANGAIGPD
jgi:channel protein (hemolysin III family)